jgi:plastocyanin
LPILRVGRNVPRMSRLPFPPAHGKKVWRSGKGQPPCRGGSVIKLDVLATNFAKAYVASLILVLLDASVPPAMGETKAPKRELVLAVTGHVRVSRVHAMDEASDDAKKASGVVIWLVPTQTSQKGRPALEFPHYQVVQLNKTFEPRLLVVPAGSIVDFPNNDPWLHNVFSISKGKQFDLGFYEARVVRSVRFDRAGVSYLFCSIHPEMMAVVVTGDSTCFGVSDSGGRIRLRDVPPGQYVLHAWRQNASAEALAATHHPISVGDDRRSLPAINIALSKSKPTIGKKWKQ